MYSPLAICTSLELAAGAAPAGGPEALAAEWLELDELSLAELALDDESAFDEDSACAADETEDVDEVDDADDVELTVVRRFSR